MIQYVEDTCPKHSGAFFCMHEGVGCAAAYRQPDGRYAVSFWDDEAVLHSSATVDEDEALNRLENWIRSFADDGPGSPDNAL